MLFYKKLIIFQKFVILQKYKKLKNNLYFFKNQKFELFNNTKNNDLKKVC